MTDLVDRSGPGVRITVLSNERAPSGDPLNLDGRIIGAGTRGPVTEKIQAAFFDIVNGRNAKYHHWLTPVK